MAEATGTPTLEGTPEEGLRVARAAAEAGLPLVLLGGVAFWVRCPSARVAPLARAYGDADFIGRSGDRKAITAFAEAQGYVADRMFNALHGATRLNFHDPARDRPLDVLLDRFHMCHELDLRDRLAAGELTLPLADLALTKLQVVQLNRKDVVDLVALLCDHGFGPDAIELDRILAVTHGDWGFEHTIRGTLAGVREQVPALGLAGDAAALVVTRIDELVAALDGAPKSARWKLRARVGERVRWYELPEEARAEDPPS
jgi:hypothetical protein